MTEFAKIRSSIMKFSRCWFEQNDWLEVTHPIIVKGAVEDGSTLFKFKYFNEVAYLSESAQLYLEALIFSLGPVWILTPSFRAKKSRTIRHLAENSHLEAETPKIEFEDILDIQERMVTYIVKRVLNERLDSLKLLEINIYYLNNVESPFKRIYLMRKLSNFCKKMISK